MDEVTIPEDIALGGEPPVTDEDFERWAGQEMFYLGPDGLPMNMPESLRAFADEDFDTERAEWAMGRLRRAQGRIQANALQAREWIERIEEWLTATSRRDTIEANYFSGVLSNMARKVNERDPSVKTIRLPSGRITSSGPAPGKEWEAKVNPAEEAVLVEWAKARFPDAVKVEESVRVKELRSHVWRVDERGVFALDPGGEVIPVPGAMPHRKERSFTVLPDLT